MTTAEAARSDKRRRRLGRRGQRGRWLPWLLAPLVLPALGAAATVALVEGAAGDLDAWTEWQSGAALGAAFVVPAALSVWFARREGAAEAAAWAVVCVGAQLGLVFGVAFLALGLGPG